MAFAVLVTFLARLSLVLLFLPFSALDKLLNFNAAIGQASEATSDRTLARGLILSGLFVEVVMSLGVLTGIADRAAAFVLAGYCAITALLWKQFWKAPDLRFRAKSQGREIFWDFLKNFAVAGGFLAVAFGPSVDGVEAFFAHPLGSTHPYQQAEPIR